MKIATLFILVLFMPMLAWAGEDPESIIAVLPVLVELYKAGAAWYVVATLALWAVLQVVLKRDGFRVPFLSDWLGGLKKPIRGLIVAALGLAVGVLSAVTTGDVGVMIESGLVGLSVALGAAGFHVVAAKPVIDMLED